MKYVTYMRTSTFVALVQASCSGAILCSKTVIYRTIYFAVIPKTILFVTIRPFLKSSLRYLVARYMVQIPNVSRLNLTSSKPAFLRIPTIVSPCGKASTVLMR